VPEEAIEKLLERFVEGSTRLVEAVRVEQEARCDVKRKQDALAKASADVAEVRGLLRDVLHELAASELLNGPPSPRRAVSGPEVEVQVDGGSHAV
jgi:hypothetical protein